jgi:DNA-binding transcriptional MocR family regulator
MMNRAEIYLAKDFDEKLTSSAKVLWTYLHFRQGKNDTAWPSQATIEAHTNISRSTIQRATHDLESLGWLIVFRTKMGTQRWNSYRVRIPKYAEVKINSGSKKKRSAHQKEHTTDSNTRIELIQNEAVKTPIKTLNKNTSTTTHQSRLVPDLSNFFKAVNE